MIWSAKPGDDSSSSCIVQPNSVDNSGENLVKTRQSEADFGSKISKYLFFFFFLWAEFLFRKLHSGGLVKFSMLQDRYISVKEGCSEIVCWLWPGCRGGNHEITKAVTNTCSCTLPAKCRTDVLVASHLSILTLLPWGSLIIKWGAGERRGLREILLLQNTWERSVVRRNECWRWSGTWLVLLEGSCSGSA